MFYLEAMETSNIQKRGELSIFVGSCPETPVKIGVFCFGSLHKNDFE